MVISKYSNYLLVTTLFLGSFTSLSGQVTLWSVDFETGYSDNDQTAQDNNLPAGADWTKTGTPSNWWRVESDNFITGSRSMSGRNTDGVMTWTSEPIDISGQINVSISIDISEVNCETVDIIETFYDIGSGNVEFGDGNGNGDFNSATNTVSGLSGTSLTIVVTLNNDGGGERLIFDNITVTADEQIGPDGPGGIGDVDGSGSLVFWLDANQGVSTTGTDVTQWSDLSGYNNNATPPAVSNRPSFDATGTNNHPVITFDGSTDFLTASDDNSLDLTNWTIMFVGICNLNKNYNAFVVKGVDGSENYEFLTNFPSTGNFHYPVLHTTSGRSSDSEAGEAISTTNYGIYQLDYDQTSFQVYINGDLTETDGETRTPQTNANDLYIANEQGVGGRNANASLGEVVIFDSPLNEAQRLIIHNAMSAKYGFNLDANNLYDEDNALNGDFDFDVAGIGQASDGSSHQDAQGTGIVRINSPSGLANSEYLIWGHDNDLLNSFGETDLPTGIQARLARTWRASETGEVGTVSISFDLSAVAGLKTASDLRLLIDADNDGVFNDESGASVIAGATNTSGDIFEWTGVDIDNNQRFTVGSINFSQTPLPIILTEFTASTTSDNKVKLGWTTVSEINNDFFTIERSRNAEDWQELKRLEGAGNSNRQIQYTEVDDNPFYGISYYRLKQTDFNGEFSYSKIEAVEIQLPLELGNLNIYPNPSDGAFTLDFESLVEGNSTLTIYNLMGSKLYEKNIGVVQGENKIDLDLGDLANGQYIVQIATNSGATVQGSINIK